MRMKYVKNIHSNFKSFETSKLLHTDLLSFLSVSFKNSRDSHLKFIEKTWWIVWDHRVEIPKIKKKKINVIHSVIV